MERLLKIDQICDLLQVSRSLVYKWMHYGFIPNVKIENMIRFKESEINRWVERKKRKYRSSYKIDV